MRVRGGRRTARADPDVLRAPQLVRRPQRDPPGAGGRDLPLRARDATPAVPGRALRRPQRRPDERRDPHAHRPAPRRRCRASCSATRGKRPATTSPGYTWSNANPFAAASLDLDRRIDHVMVGHPKLGGVGHVLGAHSPATCRSTASGAPTTSRSSPSSATDGRLVSARGLLHRAVHHPRDETGREPDDLRQARGRRVGNDREALLLDALDDALRDPLRRERLDRARDRLRLLRLVPVLVGELRRVGVGRERAADVDAVRQRAHRAATRGSRAPRTSSARTRCSRTRRPGPAADDTPTMLPAAARSSRARPARTTLTVPK